MTENGAVTLISCSTTTTAFGGHATAAPLPGVEIKVVDSDGKTLPPLANRASLLVRGCSNFGGYLKRPQLNGTDADDWFDTGDLARIDERGYVRITGRSEGRDHSRGREHSRWSRSRRCCIGIPAVAQAPSSRIRTRGWANAAARCSCSSPARPRSGWHGRVPEVAEAGFAVHPRTLIVRRRDARDALGQDPEVQIARDLARDVGQRFGVGNPAPPPRWARRKIQPARCRPATAPAGAAGAACPRH
jgi:acyl-CoA synthetase (AMP-forming)/AMP-acid ligase II